MDFDKEWIGVIAAILTTAGFAPQVYKTLKTKAVKDVSLSMYLVLFVGMGFWLFYGILIESFSIILANCISGALVLLQIFVKIIYSKRE